MGCMDSHSLSINTKTQFYVGTLNYSGILLSPYQFYEKRSILEQNFSKRMKKLDQTHNVQFQFGPFDKEWQKKRFSPLYQPTCGLKNNLYMMCQDQFRDQWWKVKAAHENQLQAFFQQDVKKTKLQSQKRKQKQHKKQQDPASTATSYNDPQNKKTKHPILPSLQKNSHGQRQLTEEQIKQKNDQLYERYLTNLYQFDFLIYKTILYEIYTELEEKEELEKNFNDRDKFQLRSKKYRDHRQEMFRKSYLDQRLKIKKTIQVLDRLNFDILFLQEASQQLLEQLEKKSNQFRIVKSVVENSKRLESRSAILIREPSFPDIRSLLEQNSRLMNRSNSSLKKKPPKQSQSPKKFKQIKQQIDQDQIYQQIIKKTNINNDTVIQVLYNLILLCPHLSSKKQKNSLQMKQLIQLIKYLKTTYRDCHIIVAGDLNNNTLKQFQFTIGEGRQEQKCKINVTPDCQFHFTVFKKRTQLQAQPKKAESQNKQTKDYVITDLNIDQAHIMTVDGRIIFDCQKKIKPESNQMFQKTLFGYDATEIPDLPLLPSDHHPYDHFLLRVKLSLPPGEHLQHITHPSYLYKYRPGFLNQAQYQQEQNREMYRQRNLKQKKLKQKRQSVRMESTEM